MGEEGNKLAEKLKDLVLGGVEREVADVERRGEAQQPVPFDLRERRLGITVCTTEDG
jgi:hypothetical protein